jgi:nucleoside phosphorylase
MQQALTTRAAGFVVRTGIVAGQRIAVAAVGADGARAARIASALITAYHPRLLASVGFVASLVDEVKIGDLVIANRLVDGEGRRVVLDVRAPSRGGTHVGTLLTVTTPPTTTAQRRQLAATYNALAADRIAMPVAMVCQQDGVPMIACGVASSGPEDRPAVEIEHLFRQTTWAAKAGALVGGIVRRPATARDLWNLKASTWQAADRIADLLLGVLSR